MGRNVYETEYLAASRGMVYGCAQGVNYEV